MDIWQVKPSVRCWGFLVCESMYMSRGRLLSVATCRTQRLSYPWKYAYMEAVAWGRPCVRHWHWHTVGWTGRQIIGQSGFNVSATGMPPRLIGAILRRFLGTSAKLLEAPSCPSVRMEQLGFHWTEFDDTSYLSFFRNCVEKFQVSLKSDENNGYFAWRCFHFYANISLNSF